MSLNIIPPVLRSSVGRRHVVSPRRQPASAAFCQSARCPRSREVCERARMMTAGRESCRPQHTDEDLPRTEAASALNHNNDFILHTCGWLAE